MRDSDRCSLRSSVTTFSIGEAALASCRAHTEKNPHKSTIEAKRKPWAIIIFPHVSSLALHVNTNWILVIEGALTFYRIKRKKKWMSLVKQWSTKLAAAIYGATVHCLIRGVFNSVSKTFQMLCNNLPSKQDLRCVASFPAKRCGREPPSADLRWSQPTHGSGLLGRLHKTTGNPASSARINSTEDFISWVWVRWQWIISRKDQSLFAVTYYQQKNRTRFFIHLFCCHLLTSTKT